MNLVASLIVRNELDRYLLDCIEILLGFCDKISIYDDGSTDGTPQALRGMDKIALTESFGSTFYQHEGAARQRALQFTLEQHPTHILAIDADELIEDGTAVRAAILRDPKAGLWSLCMKEVWGCDEDEIHVRTDGRWGPHRAHVLYRVHGGGAQLRIRDQALASGRIPANLPRSHARDTGVSILHMGWANAGEREARYQRYVEHDGGRFHNRAHLDSIMAPDVTLKSAPWQQVAKPIRQRVASRVNR